MLWVGKRSRTKPITDSKKTMRAHWAKIEFAVPVSPRLAVCYAFLPTRLSFLFPSCPYSAPSCRSPKPSPLQKQRGGEKPPGIRRRGVPPPQAMDIARCRHWGVLVRPGETVKCNPGELYCHISQIALQDDKGNEDVRVFVKVDGNRIPIGTLSVDKYPQCKIGLVFEKEFELLHSSKTSNISALGFTFRGHKIKSYSDTSTDEDDDSDEEVPLAIPLYPNADEVESGDDEDSNDQDGSESSDEVGEALKNAIGKIRPAETPLRTPVEKKAKIATPSMGNKTGSGSTNRSGYVHVATPYPSSKQVKKTPSSSTALSEPLAIPASRAARLSTPRSGYSLQGEA
ncbi:hypothetical protein GQ55_5G047900 [Panicum hallii var. hallii]|uniref:Nucleoplasmin-like domain-containing protein n=1 Tax=Panicum hallii var. hallii TaxID=1504633 RepID=A0A2T7DCU5_9POAL|nr:hypothetical protein GQ55_5G047900 [Panicum hallii var. hallii]